MCAYREIHLLCISPRVFLLVYCYGISLLHFILPLSCTTCGLILNSAIKQPTLFQNTMASSTNLYNVPVDVQIEERRQKEWQPSQMNALVEAHRDFQNGEIPPTKYYDDNNKDDDKDDKGYQCVFCDRMFANKSDRDKHDRTHTGEKPYYCIECDFYFASKYALQQHQKTHNDINFECDLCNKTFNHQTHLIRHKKLHSGERPYQCDECNQSFSLRDGLKQHKRIHTGEKPYECSHCGKCFAQSSTRNQHQRTHTGEKPYKCDFCQKAFSKNMSLVNHRCRKTYKCKRCDQLFRNKKYHAKHVQFCDE